ncbi:unnamed protein product, partial [Didymodactylos carnosus]
KRNEFCEIPGNNLYSTDLHCIGFKSEIMNHSNYMFIGIILQSKPLAVDSFQQPSSYGWGMDNIFYLNGIKKRFDYDMREDDIIDFIINCNKRRTDLYNRRTKEFYEISAIDSRKCPFPWQLNI